MARIPVTLSELQVSHFVVTTDKTCHAVPLQQQGFF